MAIATGFDFEPQNDGNVLIEFFGDDGVTFNKQIVSPNVVRNMPLVAALTDVALRKGPALAKEIMTMLSQDRGRRQTGLQDKSNTAQQ